MLDSLFLASTVSAVRAALGSAGVDGRVLVVGDAKLGKALGAEGVDVVVVAGGKPPKGVAAIDGGTVDRIPVDSRDAAAVVGVGATARGDCAAVLAEWSRVVRDGGAVVMVDRGAATDATRRALCAGLAEIEQRVAGRVIVTSGLVIAT
jgi:hypothetical protein